MAEDDHRRILRVAEDFDCDLERLWLAWTDPAAIAQWLGPPEWPAVRYHADFRVGGAWHASLRSVQDGTVLQQGGEFLAIEPPALLRFSFRWLSDNHQDGPGVATVVEVRLVPISPTRTRMEFAHMDLANAASLAGHTDGWRGTFARLHSCLLT